MARNNRGLAIFAGLCAIVFTVGFFVLSQSPAAHTSPKLAVVEEIVGQATERVSIATSDLVTLEWKISDIVTETSDPVAANTIMISMSEMRGLYQQSPFAVFFRVAQEGALKVHQIMAASAEVVDIYNLSGRAGRTCLAASIIYDLKIEGYKVSDHDLAVLSGLAAIEAQSEAEQPVISGAFQLGLKNGAAPCNGRSFG